MPKSNSAYYDLALDITRQYAKDLREANALARKPRLVESHAVSTVVKERHILASMSMNDILERFNAEALLDSPELRSKLLAIASELNSPFDRFKN